MYAAVIGNEGTFAKEEFLITGSEPSAIIDRFGFEQNLMCLVHMGQACDIDHAKDLEKLERLISRCVERTLTIRQLRLFNVTLSVGHMWCKKAIEYTSDEQLDALAAAFPTARRLSGW